MRGARVFAARLSRRPRVRRGALHGPIGATNIRVNQQQLTFKNSQRVGINRPDLQFDYNNRRYSVEYDSPASGRGPGHQARLTANNPEGDVILIIIPEK